MCPVTAWIIQGCGAVVKMAQLRVRLRSCWLSCVWLWLRSSHFSWLQAAMLPRGNHRKNNNHRLRRFREQSLAET